MLPRVVTVGPLASASATKIGLSQSPHAAGALVLNGAAGSFTANNICLSQSAAGAANLTINGALALSGTAYVDPASAIYITSAADDSSITFTVTGRDINNAAQIETLTGTNTSVVATSKKYTAITKIATSGATGGNVTVGTIGAATLDTARHVILTSGGDDSALTFTISGTDYAGTPQTETVAGANTGVASSVLSYLTVTQVKTSAATASTITIGTNGVASSPWVNFDMFAPAPGFVQTTVSGTVNYSVEFSNDDPCSPSNPVAPSAMTWSTVASPIVSATATAQSAIVAVPVWARVTLNSGSGSVTGTFVQHSAVPL